MKRGCQAHFVHFHSYPLVDMSSIEKAGELVQHLTRHQFRSTLSLVPLGEIQKQIIVATPPSYRVILYRRFMMRITEALARLKGSKAIITGESCGQVASQTLENMAVIDHVAGMPVLRPLVAYNKEEIVNVARSIGTFPISIQPDQDCCTLFVPKHPETRADLATVEMLEALLPVDDLVQQALQGTQVKKFASPETAGQLA
jgi:thiamine biosynthesis protein ThiI